MVDMEFKQAASYLNDIQKQVTGQTAIAAANVGEFTSIATTLLQTGEDPAYNAISNLVTRTIISARDYDEQFKGVEVSESAYGMHVRKLSFADKDVLDDARFLYPMAYNASQNPANGDGNSVDMFKIRKATPLQTNFYGQTVYMDRLTYFRDQLRGAFEGPAQLNAFITGQFTEEANKLKQYREDTKRGTMLNFIGGILDEADTNRVINVLSLYKTETGLSTLTAQTIKQPDNWAPFVKWLAAFVLTLSRFMEQRSGMYQTQVGGLTINRHTPRSMQRFYMLSDVNNQITTRVLSDTFNKELVRFGDYEEVAFWQSIKDPDAINVVPSRIGSDGIETTPENAVSVNNILGFICDREAFGAARVDSWNATSPFNIDGAYWNTAYHETWRTFCDHTEKGVVLLLA